MATENYPRMRERNFSYGDIIKVPSYQAGRLDLIVNERYGEPKAYKAFAVANNILDAMSTRPGIRPNREALRNELILRGVDEREVDAKVKEIEERQMLGKKDWLSYGNMASGNITDVYPERVLFVPTADTVVSWFDRYNTLAEIDEDKE